MRWRRWLSQGWTTERARWPWKCSWAKKDRLSRRESTQTVLSDCTGRIPEMRSTTSCPVLAKQSAMGRRKSWSGLLPHLPTRLFPYHHQHRGWGSRDSDYRRPSSTERSRTRLILVCTAPTTKDSRWALSWMAGSVQNGLMSSMTKMDCLFNSILSN